MLAVETFPSGRGEQEERAGQQERDVPSVETDRVAVGRGTVERWWEKRVADEGWGLGYDKSYFGKFVRILGRNIIERE